MPIVSMINPNMQVCTSPRTHSNMPGITKVSAATAMINGAVREESQAEAANKICIFVRAKGPTAHVVGPGDKNQSSITASSTAGTSAEHRSPDRFPWERGTQASHPYPALQRRDCRMKGLEERSGASPEEPIAGLRTTIVWDNPCEGMAITHYVHD